ncbi:hypothetical protein Lalb_Chr05g0228201 [Lupinus albus]|uniref:Uncharacterized protein n=1 Tax=Lupinus albus TaxID=3870 RepID=A0A6A4QKF5_LUPAL|nr:hypothetical protein Lalb_Chr05g0228201 [Lupinus albus]
MMHRIDKTVRVLNIHSLPNLYKVKSEIDFIIQVGYVFISLHEYLINMVYEIYIIYMIFFYKT